MIVKYYVYYDFVFKSMRGRLPSQEYVVPIDEYVKAGIAFNVDGKRYKGNVKEPGRISMFGKFYRHACGKEMCDNFFGLCSTLVKTYYRDLAVAFSDNIMHTTSIDSSFIIKPEFSGQYSDMLNSMFRQYADLGFKSDDTEMVSRVAKEKGVGDEAIELYRAMDALSKNQKVYILGDC